MCFGSNVSTTITAISLYYPWCNICFSCCCFVSMFISYCGSSSFVFLLFLSVASINIAPAHFVLRTASLLLCCSCFYLFLVWYFELLLFHLHVLTNYNSSFKKVPILNWQFSPVKLVFVFFYSGHIRLSEIRQPIHPVWYATDPFSGRLINCATANFPFNEINQHFRYLRFNRGNHLTKFFLSNLRTYFFKFFGFPKQTLTLNLKSNFPEYPPWISETNTNTKFKI